MRLGEKSTFRLGRFSASSGEGRGPVLAAADTAIAAPLAVTVGAGVIASHPADI